MHRPERTCIGCRGRGDKASLLRLVSFNGAVALDRAQTAPGRGAYLHPSTECVRLAVRRRGLVRALRSPVEWSRLAEVVAPAVSPL
ncbi:MAG: YlxR family protein [Actinomycetes bacterium]